MRYFPEAKRTVVIPEDASTFSMFDDSFKEVSRVDLATLFGAENNQPKIKDSGALEVFDVCFVPLRDLYCYCSADHTITMMKPHSDTSGKKIHYSLYNRVHHGYRHVKLCWSERAKVLCSISTLNDIFGWTLEGHSPVFQVSRHKEMITDFLSIDDLGFFATCSLDKSVVLWSQSTQRVRGVLMGHTRGIKVMSYAKNTLITAGFEMDARVWNLSLQENTLILRGHRAPLVAAKVMCQPKELDVDQRALTVDTRGEFRLWDVRVKSGTDIKIIGAMMCFSMQESSMSQVKFLAVPYNPKYSRESYSNFICGTSKLIQFKPEKNCKEFLPCNQMVYSSGNTSLVLAVGRSLFKYDIITGAFQSCIPNLDKIEIRSFCADDRHRIYVGCTNGDVLLIKFSTGQILSSIRAHHRAVTALSLVRLGKGCNLLFTGASDGTLRSIDDTLGRLAVHNTVGNVFHDNLSIDFILNLKEAKIVLAANSLNSWGAWTDTTLKCLFTFKEDSRVIDMVEIMTKNPSSDTYGRGVATVVICTASYLKIYALDFKHTDYQLSHMFGNANTFVRRTFSSCITLKCPDNSINYSESEISSGPIPETTLLVSVLWFCVQAILCSGA